MMTFTRRRSIRFLGLDSISQQSQPFQQLNLFAPQAHGTHVALTTAKHARKGCIMVERRQGGRVLLLGKKARFISL
jgi:hypothetical protein